MFDFQFTRALNAAHHPSIPSIEIKPAARALSPPVNFSGVNQREDRGQRCGQEEKN
jgi:hypothetical protein